MSTRPVYILLFIIGALLLVIAYRYEQYVHLRNFTIDVQAPCDPTQNDCFVSDCSPTDDPSCDTTPYDKVTILDSQAPGCLEEHECAAFACAAGQDCSIEYCTDATTEDGEACSGTPATASSTQP